MSQHAVDARPGTADRLPPEQRNPDDVSTTPALLIGLVARSDSGLEPRGADAAGLDSWCASYKGGSADLFHDPRLTDPRLASRLAEGAAALPPVGSEFCGFKLVAELGRGAFGRVFLGQQGDLADRPVALKVSTEIREESQRLARLQHTNIVPIYSFHRQGPLQAVCMPYYGSATLADVAAELSRRDALPDSGKMVVSTVCDRRSRTLRTAGSTRPAPADRPAPPVAPTAEGAAPAPEALAARGLKRLEGLTYVESILWIGARLADGLAHAHERGILHRDLKPANVLLTDDGQPMLLDFNLAADAARPGGAAAAQIGGTLPYMAPEHLQAYGGDRGAVDARSDLYGLGVILFELLTGRTPFVRRTGPPETILPEMIAERRKGAPGLRRYSKAVSPAAEAVVRKCLEPDPARRYQSAAELKEDLERQLAHLPLRYQREPSRSERARKWLRRNRWVRSTGAASAASAVLVASLGALALGHMRRAEGEAAVNRLAEFRRQHRAAQSLLYARTTAARDEEEGREAARRALALYGLPDEPAWRERSAVRRLPPEERERLAGEAGQLLVLVAASSLPDDNPTPDARAEALRLNRRAEQCFGAGPVPRALWAQRAELVGDPAEAARLRDEAARTPLREGWDHYLAAVALKRAGKTTEAIAEAREAVRADPASFAGWFLLGNCYLRGSDAYAAKIEAAAHYTTCVSLRPDYWAPYFNRGLAHLDANDYARAEKEFNRAAALLPDHAETYLLRALAREKQSKWAEAAADADRALAGGADPARVYLLRARLRERLGDRAGAEQDLAKGLEQSPLNDWGWIDRGMARLNKGDDEGALQDFAEAARCNPLSRDAIQDQAYVLGERLKRPADAVRLLDRELELYPDQPAVILSRGVYHARLGHRDAAITDARRAVDMAPRDGGVLYRAACVYALTSQLPGDPRGDRRRAIGYLADALQCGFGFEYVDSDDDMAPLRNDPEFAELRKFVGKTRELKGWL
jgi:serine/threonine protein kinase/Tfp pilus assembly protein PilF